MDSAPKFYRDGKELDPFSDLGISNENEITLERERQTTEIIRLKKAKEKNGEAQALWKRSFVRLLMLLVLVAAAFYFGPSVVLDVAKAFSKL